jgi:hypothetical protein
VLPAIPRQVVAELVLALDGLLRHVAVTANRKAVREYEQRQVGRGVDAVIEVRELVRKLVDHARSRGPGPGSQNAV